MSGYAPRLPLVIDQIDGAYGLVKDLNLLAQQNLKMLILTEPGERMMIPQYGVGLKRQLFENNNPALQSSITGRITSQVSKYLPYINIKNIDINTSPDGISTSEQAYQVTITYFIVPLQVEDMLTINI